MTAIGYVGVEREGERTEREGKREREKCREVER